LVATLLGMTLGSLPPTAPRPLRDLRHELIDALGREAQRLSLLGALIRTHEHFHNFDTIIEGKTRLFLAEKDTHEVPVLVLVTVRHCLARDHRHQSYLGVLLLDQIFPRSPLHLPAEEKLE